MSRSHRASLWTAALAALCGTALVGFFLFSQEPQGAVLNAAMAAALVSAVSLLVSVLFACGASRPGDAAVAQARVNEVRAAPEETPLGCMDRRRAILDERLAIDRPRQCGDYAVPCTCWSLCGTAGDKSEMGHCPARYAVPAGDAGLHRVAPANDVRVLR